MPAFSNGFSSGFDAEPITAPGDPLLGVPIEILRQHVGLAPTDPSKDAEIQTVFAIALGVVEDYLDRILAYGSYTETETHFGGNSVHLKAYPLDVIDVLVSNDAVEPEFHEDKLTGVVMLDGYQRFHELNCSYRGGYQTLPGTLMMVVIGTFDAVYSSIMSSGGTTSLGKEIKATVIDGMRVEYFDSASSTTSDAAFGLIPSGMISMLQPYRRQYA